MSQDKDGGYCSKCDTVWASPGKCRCVEFNDIWNAAIEAAAKFVHPDNVDRMRKELKK